MTNRFVWALVGTVAIAPGCGSTERLGAEIFFDQHLSINDNQSCAACHGPTVGWTGPLAELNALGAVYEGSIPGRFGNRKPPSSAYAAFVPVFQYDPTTGFFGGNFWDGRATGWKLGNAAADQAQGPFLNPVEQALPSGAEVVRRVCAASYGGLFRRLWGAEACTDTATGYNDVARSIKDFEASDRVSSFTSKYDAYVRGEVRLTGREMAGLTLFKSKARCTRCHVTDPEADGTPALFGDGGYDNLGIPKNPENPFYRMNTVLVNGQPLNPLGADWIDTGLAGFLNTLAGSDGWRSLPYVSTSVQALSSATLAALAEENRGKFRTVTLRNVAKKPSRGFIKAYGHNGYFKSLKSIVHFYNTRDVLAACPTAMTEPEALAADCWPPPEVPENLNTTDFGSLGLTGAEEDAIVAFLETLSDEDPR